MKNQYFGDINDYRKYGLLRSILLAGKFKMLVAWMLTPGDGSTDGKFISYLENPGKWSKHDPILFHQLKEVLAGDQSRNVSLIEDTGLLPEAEYFSVNVPDHDSGRKEWVKLLSKRADGCDFVFLDPDNGLEVKSVPYGRRNSSKYLYWHEVEVLWAAGKSLLIYQHFIREKRVDYVQRMLEALKRATPGSLVEAFSTPNVVFLLALQPEHKRFHEAIVSSVQERWPGQIQHWELTLAQQNHPGTDTLNKQFAGTNSVDNTERCPFCHLKEEKIFFSSELVKGIWDSYPLNPGHALLVPHRHIARWFDATAEEQVALTSAIEQARAAIEERYSPQGFNIGFNDQKAAGQTVPHLHIHVIPRYEGDVADPRGGIRTIIPARAAYWEGQECLRA